MNGQPHDPAPAPGSPAARRSDAFWRSLDELAGTPAFAERLGREFPDDAPIWSRSLSRRSFLNLMGASLALGGLSACRAPRERILPYVEQPENVVPGKPLLFATAMTLGGYGIGLLVESHMGRPTKVEGNPSHPASLGATDAFAQASILSLYDPDRPQAVLQRGRISTWSAFVQAMTKALDRLRPNGGQGLRILTETVTSPTLQAQLADVLATFPAARWHQWEAVNGDQALLGARMAFGREVQVQHRLDRAEVIVALDADFLLSSPGRLRHARDWARGRQADRDEPVMNRLYVVESSPSITGSVADHRLPLRAREVEAFARALAAALGLETTIAPPFSPATSAWLDAVAADLKAHRGRSVVIAGEQQPAIVHALAHAINATLGNAGQTVIYTEPVVASPTVQAESLQALVADMQAGNVALLVIAGGNPVYTAPADVPFRDALQGVPLSVHLGFHADETAGQVTWFIPETHYLEAWSDVRAYDGTVSIVQPLIAPLYQSKSVHELIAVLQGNASKSGYDIIRAYWQGRTGQSEGERFESWWQQALISGTVPGTAAQPVAVSAKLALPAAASPKIEDDDDLEITFRPDPTVWDGRFANNGWLQELPKPLTKLTWDNAALISPATASDLGLRNGDLVDLTYRRRTVRAPVWILPGQPDGSVAVHLGYGRRQVGSVGEGLGFDANRLRTADALGFGTGLSVQKVGRTIDLATTQHAFLIEGRSIVMSATLAEYEANPDFAQTEATTTPAVQLYPDWPYEGHRWGMTVNLNACIGCNACVVACQAENNVPVVGREGVQQGRAMHWLRVDTYYKGDAANPRTYHQPVPCMHCEKAPCEQVCPVEATVHSSEGLNEMVYNRCIGTRYCSNNCPYKVRRFNFLDYRPRAESLQLVHNPEVTVRSRGVMEKCTYCVQRIARARSDARTSNRPLKDGEVMTACQQVCPTEAIVFGDLNDPAAKVRQLKAAPTHYALLADLNTQPRTTYLAKLENPNPALQET